MLKRITLTKNKKDTYNLSTLYETGKGLSMSEKIKDIELVEVSNIIVNNLKDELTQLITKDNQNNGNN